MLMIKIYAMKGRTVLLFAIVFFSCNYFASAQKLLTERRYWSFQNTMAGLQTINSIQLSTGVELEYMEQGDASGIPVVLLHGYTDSRHSFEIVLPYLPETIHAFALTQRGHGNSSKPKSNYHPRDFAADVAAFIKETKTGKAVIVGHSMGGVVAQQFALDYPELTKAIVIISSDAAFKDNPGLPEFRQEVLKLSDPVDYAFAESFQKGTIARPVDSNYLKLYINETTKVPARVWKEVINGIMSVDYRKELHRLNQPALILWGDKDAICLKADQDILVNEITNAKLMVYEGTGHALHWEEPQRFASDLVNFINKVIPLYK